MRGRRRALCDSAPVIGPPDVDRLTKALLASLLILTWVFILFGIIGLLARVQ